MSRAVPLSVIVCTHNRAGYLAACLESVTQQDCHVPFEIIVVDNASTDGTADILSAWCSKDARIRAITEPRIGLSVAKNTGVRLALGELLLFTDDDVIVSRDWVRSYNEFFRRASGDLLIAGGPILPVTHDLGPWPDWLDNCAEADMGLLDYGSERPLDRYEYVWGANMAIPARLFSRVGPWNETIGRQADKRGTFEDTEYQDRIRALGGAIWFCPSARLRHRFPREQIVPSRLLRTAFTRGRNEFWKSVIVQRAEGRFSPSGNYVRSLARLAKELSKLTLWSLAFTLEPTPSSFSRAHTAAMSSGRAVDILRAGRESSRLSSTIGQTSFFVLDSVLAMVRAGREGRG